LVAVGGAGSVDDFAAAVQAGASAAAAGSFFVFNASSGRLISYPGQTELKSKVFQKLVLQDPTNPDKFNMKISTQHDPGYRQCAVTVDGQYFGSGYFF